MAAHNRGVILRLLTQWDASSRRELAHRSGLVAATITHIVAGFLARGLVREREPDDVPARPRRGRREIAVELVPRTALAVGVHVGVDQVRAALCDLRGTVLCQRSVVRPANAPADSTLADTAHLVRALLAESRVSREQVTGVGVGAVAFVDPGTGVVQSAPSLGWDEGPVAARLGEQVCLPVLLEHHVRAMALAEHWFGQARQLENFALMHVDTSIGVGLMIDGQLLRGDGRHAGQIAHMIVADDGPFC